VDAAKVSDSEDAKMIAIVEVTKTFALIVNRF